MFKFMIVSLVVVTGLMALAKPPEVNPEDEKIVKANIPSKFKNYKDFDGKVVPLSDVGYVFKRVNLDGDKNQYLVVLYSVTHFDRSEDCILSTINLSTKKVTVAKPKIDSELGNCDTLEAVDLDGDGKPEIIEDSVDIKTGSREHYLSIFKWTGSELKEITPTKMEDGELRSQWKRTYVTPILGVTYIFEPPFLWYLHGELQNSPVGQMYKLYKLQNEEFSLIGTYDFFKIYRDEKPLWRNEDEFELKEPGSYEFEVKNVSDGKDPVQAELTVNGLTIFKRSDFCESGVKSDKEDFKTCKQKTPSTAIVELKEKNHFSMKVFGSKESAVQLIVRKR